MKVYVIGASGLIGSSLCGNLLEKGYKTVGSYFKNKKKNLFKYDLSDTTYPKELLNVSKDDTVFLMSAVSNPSWIYANQNSSFLINVEGTKRFVDFINDIGCRLIFMSSVEVFDGNKGNYCENDKPNPLNVYGHMKKEVEDYLVNHSQHFCIVRTGWNVGWNLDHRCVVTLTYETLMKPGALMATDNNFSITDVDDTSKCLAELVEHKFVKCCHIASEKSLLRFELADLVMQYSKHSEKMNYQKTTFDKIPYTEKRSRLNNLDNSYFRSLYNYSYKDPEDIVKRKVELLDNNF